MLEKKGVSPILCQTGAQTQGNGGPTQGVGPPSAPSAQQSAICSQPMNDTNNGLEPKRCGSKGTTSASSSGPNTPLGDQMMAPMTASQDFVIIKSEDQMPPNAANHCDNKTKLNVETQLRSNHMIDTKPNINTLNANVNMCGNRDNITANNGMKCRDNVMSCGANGAINGPMNGMNCINNTSPLNHLLNDDKLTSFGNEFGIPMPVPTGNLPVPGDLPPFPLMSQPMNTRMRGRGPCGPPLAQGPRMPINAPLHSQPHNNMHQMVANNNMPPQKSSMTMESQYMQQQSQIFVFNTKVANDAADAVDKGSFASIIDYHCANPETKRLLEKFPLKAPINRGNCSAVWLNNMAQQKQGGRGLKPNVSNAHLMHPSMMKNSFGGPRESGPCNTSGPGPGGGMGGNWPNNMNNMCPNPNAGPNWSAPQQQMFAQNSDINPNNVFTNSPIGANIRGCPPFGSNNFGPNPQMFNNSPNPGMGGPTHGGPPQPPQEIPDETLTEEQRQNRVKKLALLRSMQQQLCPEMMDPSLMGHMMRMPAPNQPMNASDFINDQNMYPMSESDPMANTDPHMNPSRMIANPNNTQNHTSMPPTSGAASLEWQKANFLDDRRRKSQANGQGVHNTNNSVPISHQSPLSQPSSALNSPNPCISQSPGSRIPPPPYNQGIRSHSSPHPASPVTGSLPMPSPRMQSPADSQFTSGARLTHTSPGPPTPSADSNSSLSGHWSKHMSVSSAPNTIPSNTSSSTAVKNSGRNQGSNNVTNIRANTPSSIGPSHSPSNVKKLPNLMTGKGLGDCSDLLINSGEPNRPLHPNDVPLMGPTVATNCSSPFICNKQEPALMPVPSPQQIQYLNTFEGQELTIQKQPNTSLRDTDLIAHASDLDIGFNNEFANSCQPFATNERMPNFPLMDGMNARFASNPQNPNMSGNQFEMSARFMTPPDNNQRFGGPVFDGSAPRMMNSHESQFRPQNMLCMPYPQMDNNMMRFSSPCDNLMPPRGMQCL
ncbi:unnamed protein product [Medioppia subpectinata]|uniref:B-cell lymphoma 9 beta-catenin binding domain-containing protein n=1 Tax=Medioppia subpectinata TaxID=1979941 RepID=A0A7R9KZU2_9ACAR|nr:unnamed protein product [Medioppia subpectinata]CAG2111772.1 unnamed protein product [Medioppia subpectinata]